MSDWKRLEAALQAQRAFSDKFFDPATLTLEQKQEVLKTFVLSLHSEATGIAEGINYKDHRTGHPVDIQKILYESVDAYRYVLAICNLWGIDADTFSAALSQKDDFLHFRNMLEGRRMTPGQSVVLFDMDDVLAQFRVAFCSYATQLTGHFIDPECPEYYNLNTFRRHGIDNEEVFRSFIDSHGFLSLQPDDKYMGFLRRLKAAGHWIQIVTARPAEDLTIYYDTYSWLARNGVDVDGVTFTPEKFRWLAEQKFYGKHPVFAVDDSAKHAAEYAKHGVAVVVPEKAYNREVAGLPRISYVPVGDDPMEHIYV